MSLNDNAYRLTRPHLTNISGTLAERPALLDELTSAAKPGNDGAAGGSSGAFVPVNVSAIALLQDIEREARDHHRELTGAATGKLADIIRTWAVDSINAEWYAFLERVTLGWIDRIENLLRPAKPRRKMMLPCPSCGQTFHGPERAVCLTVNCWGDDERMTHPAQWDVRCESCGAQWTGDTLKWLLAALQTEGANA